MPLEPLLLDVVGRGVLESPEPRVGNLEFCTVNDGDKDGVDGAFENGDNGSEGDVLDCAGAVERWGLCMSTNVGLSEIHCSAGGSLRY